MLIKFLQANTKQCFFFFLLKKCKQTVHTNTFLKLHLPKPYCRSPAACKRNHVSPSPSFFFFPSISVLIEGESVRSERPLRDPVRYMIPHGRKQSSNQNYFCWRKFSLHLGVFLSSYSQLSQIVSTKKPDWRSRDATI